MAIADEFVSSQQGGNLLLRFELAWKDGSSPPNIDDFLPPEKSLRLKTLIDLAHVDLERRLNANFSVKAQDYLNDYQELAADPAIARELMEAERALRLNLLLEGRNLPSTFGNYRIDAKIGEGGMGLVFRAVHSHLQKAVAIKILPRDSMTDPQAVARFRREKVAIGQLDHPNIIRATDAGEVDGVHFLAMDFVAGIDLGKLLTLRGRLSPADACALVVQAANGLQCAHEHGLVHRDIKPSNLMLSKTGELKILDLGLALMHGKADITAITKNGQAMGTYDFMAPEQWKSCHEVDVRADIYSLGCTLYTLLVGRPPFSGPGYETQARKMNAHLDEPIKSVTDQRPEVPLPVGKLIERMVAKDMADRPATPAEVADALAPFRDGADLGQVARHAIARRDAKLIENPDNPVVPGSTDTYHRMSTKDVAISTPPINGVKKWMVAVIGVLGLTVLVSVAIIQPWSWGSQKIDNPPVVIGNEIPPPDVIPVGKKHDLLNRAPTQIVWPEKSTGSNLIYDETKKWIWANCEGDGVLQLGTAPRGRYDLEIEFSRKTWTGSFGVYFRGRDERSGEMAHVRADALELEFSKDSDSIVQWGILSAFPKIQKVPLSCHRSGLIAAPQPGINRMKITVGFDGLESFFWNDTPVDQKICEWEPHHIPRAGAEGSFGIYLANSTATIHSAHFFIHP